MIPDDDELSISQSYHEGSLVVSSSVCHEVEHPGIVPPPGHSQGEGTISIEYVLVVSYLWFVASNTRWVIPDIDELSIARNYHEDSLVELFNA